MAQSRAPIRLSWRRKLFFSGITVLGFFSVLEIILACVGVDPINRMRDPFVGFEPGVPLFVRRGDQYETNELKLSFFNHQSFPVTKSSKAVRIFCLGESTTYGHPFDYRMSYPAWVGAYLAESEPERDWQVINCGGISYASYRLALLMEELVEYQPDLFIIYVGHNEFLEERSYRDVHSRNPMIAGALHIAAYSRTARLIHASVDHFRPPPAPLSQMAAEVDTILERGAGPQAYRRDLQLRDGVVSHYRFSLEKMLQLADKCGAKVILVQPASNLRDFSPFHCQAGEISAANAEQWKNYLAVGRKDLQAENYTGAIENLSHAVALDPQNASGWWFLGHAYLEAHHVDDALQCLVRAKDEDVCPLRALTAIQQIVVDVSRTHNVELVDYPQMLAKRCRQELGHDVVGVECFFDHVHPTSEAHEALGRALFERLEKMEIVRHSENSAELSRRVHDRVTSKLDSDYFGVALQRLAMTLSWAGKNDEALRICEAACQALPENSEVWSQHGRLLEKLQRGDEALLDYQKAVTLNPDDSLALSRLGGCLMQREKFEEARGHLQRAIKLTPERAPLAFRYGLRLKLGDCELALGHNTEAEREYRAALALDGQAPEAHQRLASIRRSK